MNNVEQATMISFFSGFYRISKVEISFECLRTWISFMPIMHYVIDRLEHTWNLEVILFSLLFIQLLFQFRIPFAFKMSAVRFMENQKIRFQKLKKMEWNWMLYIHTSMFSISR